MKIRPAPKQCPSTPRYALTWPVNPRPSKLARPLQRFSQTVTTTIIRSRLHRLIGGEDNGQNG